MTGARETGTAALGQPLLTPPHRYPDLQPPQYVIVLPPYRPVRRRIFRKSIRRRIFCFSSIILFLIAAAVAYVFWPSDPELSIVSVGLDRLDFRPSPEISLDITLNLTVKVRNRNFYSIDYDSLLVAVGYRGRTLGFMTSGGGGIRARGSSYVNARLRLDGVEMLTDAISLLEDLARGAIPFNTVSEITGEMNLSFLDFPLKAKVSCEVLVNTRNQTITRQNCYPEF